MVVLVDDEDRENEGDLVLAAQFVSPEAINALTRLAGGYLCLSLTEADCDRLALHPQSPTNTTVRGTPFTVSIDAHPRHGISTGISAADRATTIRLAVDPNTTPDDFVRPGHINPLRSRDGGVLVRTGQTEGAVDLCRLAGLRPAALIIEIIREDGQMARRPDLDSMCKKHWWKMGSVEQIIQYRLARERLVKRETPERGAPITTPEGPFTLLTLSSVVDPLPQYVLTLGGVGDLDPAGRVIESDAPTLVRMHRANLLGDVFGGAGSPGDRSSAAVLRESMRAIQREGRGAIVYLRHSDPGPGGTAANGGTVPMPLREYGVGGQVLRELGLRNLRLLTNHPRAVPGLDAFGLRIVENVALPEARA